MASMPAGTPGSPLRVIGGAAPALGSLPPGCAFAPRCPERFDLCEAAPPERFATGPGCFARCYLYAPAHIQPSSRARRPGAEG